MRYQMTFLEGLIEIGYLTIVAIKHCIGLIVYDQFDSPIQTLL